MTPVASESGAVSLSGSSGPSNGDDRSPNSTSISTASQPSQNSQQQLQVNNSTIEPATVGLCNLATENQLKDSLLGKDRIFLLVLAKEIEGFIARVMNGETPSTDSLTISTSTLAALGPSFVVIAVAASKYQRMLVYKAAEWYGLKAVPGAETSMIIGIMGSLIQQRYVVSGS